MKAAGAQGVVQLGVDEMDLPQVGLSWVLLHPRAVLNSGSGMGITFNADALNQPNARLRGLAEGMGTAAVDRYDAGVHGGILHTRTMTRLYPTDDPVVV